MDFRTKINLSKGQLGLAHNQPLLLVGSCFSKNIGSRLEQHKFNVLTNPLGISYNPISIHKTFLKHNHLRWNNKNGIFFNYDFHSELNGLSEKECNVQYENKYKEQNIFLKKCDTIFITYGTAWVYELTSNNQIVNNCHKQPNSLFKKRLLEQSEIIYSWKNTKKELTELYQKDFNFVFTLSPIRHLKNGTHENQISKAILLLAINQICKESSNCFYFPSYEIVMDDLRDYRFYEDNLTHPNSLAIDYIWEKLGDSYFSSKTKELNIRIKKLLFALKHKAFHPESDQHQLFLKKIHKDLLQFEKETQISFENEIKFIQKQIKS